MSISYHHDVMEMPRILRIVKECIYSCEQMIVMALRMPDVQRRTKKIRLLMDCADTCILIAKFLSRGSYFAKKFAEFCAYVCEKCGRECLRHPDPESQRCGRICLKCAKECRKFAEKC